MKSLTFGTDTARDKYEEFLQEYSEYKEDETSIKKAKNLSISAWHLVDWVFEDYKTSHNFDKIGDFRETLYPTCQSLKIMHDLANASKHMNLNRPKANLKNTEKHIGPFTRQFTSQFDKTYLKIELYDSTELRFEDEIDKVKVFWDNYLKNKY
ncbi:MAG: hypothetical protein ABJK28_16540 [Algibacter sp.]